MQYDNIEMNKAIVDTENTDKFDPSNLFSREWKNDDFLGLDELNEDFEG